jgi:hypothetical protein
MLSPPKSGRKRLSLTINQTHMMVEILTVENAATAI